MKIFVLVIYIILIFANLLLFKGNKHSRFVEYLTLLFLLIIMGGNTMCADYAEYEDWYETQDYPIIMEPGYIMVTYYFSSMGFSFVQFRLLYYSVFFIIVLIALARILSNCHLILLFYLLFSFIIDTIQIRNTMAIAFLLLAITYLAEGKKNIFFIYIVMSVMFHYSFAIYSFLLFYKQLIRAMEKHPVIIFSITFLLCVAALAGSSFSIITNIVSVLWGDTKVQYFSARALNLVFLLLPLSTYVVTKRSRYVVVSSNISCYHKNFADIVFALSILFILLMPILVFSYDFSRMIKNIGIEVVTLVSLVFMLKRGNIMASISNNYWFRYKMSFLFFLLLWLIIGQYWEGYNELFNNNTFFEDKP